VPDNDLSPVLLRFPVRRSSGLDQQLQRQPRVSDRGLAFIVVHSQSEPQGQGLILEVRLSGTGEPGSLDCSATPAGAPTTYLFGDVKSFGADDSVVLFPLPDVENSLRKHSPDADVEFLCNLYGPNDRAPMDSRSMRLTPPLN
jgi:hypothetical protein